MIATYPTGNSYIHPAEKLPVAEYASLWALLKAQGGLSAVKKPERGEGGTAVAEEEGGTKTRLFGSSVRSNAVVFMLDISGSMKAIDPKAQRENIPKRKETAERAKPLTAEERIAERKRIKASFKTRLQRAQKELKKVISNLPSSIKINIIAFSDHVSFWRPGDGNPEIHALNDANRASALSYVDSFRHTGQTATDKALIDAYKVRGARTFYLLSDGAPTRTGKKMQVSPEGIPFEEIYQIVDDHDDERHIVIHTLGFSGAADGMMLGLAERTGGTYTKIK